MTDKLTLTRVYEDHQVERVQTHLDEKRGRSVEIHVEHHGPRDYTSEGATGRREATNYTLTVFLVETVNYKGDRVLEARLINPSDPTGVYGESKPLTPLVQVTPDPRMFR